MLAEQRLFGVLEGRQMPAGFVALNGALLSAIVEYQTMGRLIDRDQKKPARNNDRSGLGGTPY